MMISPGSIKPVYEVSVEGLEFTIATEYGRRIDFVSTNDTQFKTPEAISIGSSFESVSLVTTATVVEELGWACFVELPSGWKAAFEIERKGLIEHGWRPCEEQVSPASTVAFFFMRSSIPHPLSDLPIPPGAYDVQESSAVAGELDHISFKLEREYPSKTVLDLYSQYFQSADWVKCQGSSDDWHPIFDSTVRPTRMVHRLSRHWVDKDRNKLALVGIRYYSPDDWSYENKPAGTTQHVVIAIHQTPDLKRRLQELNLNCPPEKIP